MPKSFLQKLRRLTVSRFQKAGIKVCDRSHCGCIRRVETASCRFNPVACSVMETPTSRWFSLIKQRLNPGLHFRAQSAAVALNPKKTWRLFSDLLMSQICGVSTRGESISSSIAASTQRKLPLNWEIYEIYKRRVLTGCFFFFLNVTRKPVNTNVLLWQFMGFWIS